jgi:hypothetical protein
MTLPEDAVRLIDRVAAQPRADRDRVLAEEWFLVDEDS